MPNRILRDWTDSKTMNALSWQEEVFFTRLIMKADDFGNFYADSALIKSLLFPRKDGLRTTDIDGWLKNLEAAQLIRCYPAKGDTFLHIRNFGQRLRQTKRQFPEEPKDVSNLSATCQQPVSNLPPETKRNETKENQKDAPDVFVIGKGYAPSFIPPSVSMCEEFFTGLGFSQELGQKFHNEYQITGWYYKGSPVNSWKALANKWATNEKKFTGTNEKVFSKAPLNLRHG